ncbi:MAG: ABC transporter ATP-binding protein [Sedimenticolaceae bacterium]
MLSVSGLAKGYRSGTGVQQIFEGLSFRLQTAEVVALLGASGSGKTTLLNLLSGIDRPDAGQVAIDGTDIHALKEPDRTLLRRRDIGFVFQFFNLIPTLTVGENIALPMELTGSTPAQIQSRVAQLLADVGLAHTADRYPETLSGGEQQRTAVARALSHRPKVLLADEPTGNLDEDSGQAVISLLTGLARGQGTTMLIVTHSTTVAAAADRVLRLQHGQLRDA